MVTQKIQKRIEGLSVLVADSNAYMRRLTRVMLTNLGVKAIYEANDGVSALEAIRNLRPDVLILDWDVTALEAREVMRIVRSPGRFPYANLPVIMLIDLALFSRVTESVRLGAHEVLLKPVSPKLLQQRLLGIAINARPMVRAGNLYIPMPRHRDDLNEFIHTDAGNGERGRLRPRLLASATSSTI